MDCDAARLISDLLFDQLLVKVAPRICRDRFAIPAVDEGFVFVPVDPHGQLLDRFEDFDGQDLFERLKFEGQRVQRLHIGVREFRIDRLGAQHHREALDDSALVPFDLVDRGGREFRRLVGFRFVFDLRRSRYPDSSAERGPGRCEQEHREKNPHDEPRTALGTVKMLPHPPIDAISIATECTGRSASVGSGALGPLPKWFQRCSHPSKSDAKRWRAWVLPEIRNDFAEGWG